MKKISTSDAIAIVAASLSLAALAVSIKSCQTSDTALNLSHQQYIDDRQLILHGTFSDKNDSIKLNSTNASSILIEGRAIFPSSISNTEWKIRTEDKTIFLEEVKFAFKKIIKEKYSPVKGHAIFSESSEIPLVIESSYTSHGKRYRDLSLYILEISFLIIDDIYSEPDITFKGLKFSSRYDGETKFKRELVDIFNQK